MTATKAASLRNLTASRPTFRTMDAVRAGTPRTTLTRLVRQGDLTRVSRGVYAWADRATTEHDSLLEVSIRTPQAVFCLLTALQFHQLTTQSPAEVWLALPNKARTPRMSYPPLHVVRYSRASLTEGVETHLIEGQSIRMYNVAKTVADCFKFRNKIGIDIAIEALKDAWQQQKVTMADLYYYGKICRVEKIMRPYLEFLV
jgi:predicted transcriptional regulator of viral defense system